MADPQRIDFASYAEGTEVDFRCTETEPAFAINGAVRRCLRCDRLGVQTAGLGGRTFYLHAVTVDLERPVAEWETDACAVVPPANVTGGVRQLPARLALLAGAAPRLETLIDAAAGAALSDPAALCMCGHPAASHTEEGAGPCIFNGAQHGAPYLCPRFRKARR